MPKTKWGIVLAALWVTNQGVAQERCRLPAYAHNDYENRRPLHEALDLGFAGVEADYYLVNGQLLVGHDAGNLRSDRTLQSMYLDPIRQIVREQHSICSGAKPFLLTIEAKQRSPAAFDSLKASLERYPELVAPDGPVQVVLVGWLPPFDILGSLGVQFRVRSAAQLDSIPSDPHVRLISVRYGDLFSWRGRGEPGEEFLRRLTALAARAHQVSNRRLRVYEVPGNNKVYRALLDGGVDLIGVKDIERSRDLF